MPCDPIETIKNAASAVWDGVEDFVQAAWDNIVEPLVEPIFDAFGISDETVVQVAHLTSPFFSDNTVNVVQAATARAILEKIKTDSDFWPKYVKHIFRTKGEMRAYYNFADRQFFAGLPDVEVSGITADLVAIKAAIEAETLIPSVTLVTVTSKIPTSVDWFKWDLQNAPENYQAWDQTLTTTDAYGTSYSDWTIQLTEYDDIAIPPVYDITVQRLAETAEFRLVGPNQVTEGDTATYRIMTNRAVPIGKTAVINLAYTGTAVDGTDYTEVASVTMLAETSEITVDIVTLESATVGSNFTISIDSIPNTGSVWENVSTAWGPSSQTTAITDDDSLILTLNDVVVDEANVNITIDVKLEQAAPSGAFSVDYAFTDLGTTVGGSDYDNTTGTLNFVGTVGEIQQITIAIYDDASLDNYEQFEVYLTNLVSSDAIGIGVKSTVTILDDSFLPPANLKLVVNKIITKPDYTKESGIIAYYEDDAGTPGQNEYWWIHPHSDVTYDLVPEQRVISELEMFPMAILRKNKQNLDVVYGVGSQEYKDTKNLLARLGYKLTDMLTAIEENPDKDQVDDAYINFSMQPLDTNKVLSKLLWITFYELIVTESVVSNINSYIATLKHGDIENAMVWSEQTYTASIAGVKTTVGEYLHTIVGTNLNIYYQTDAGNYAEIVIESLNGMAAINYQTYHEMAMFALGATEFTIPVSWNTFKQLNAPEMLEIYQFLIRIDFNAIVITDLDWYETEAFFNLFEFAMAVVNLVTLGTASGPIAFFTALVYNYVINYAIAELIIWVAEETGSAELAALTGVVAGIWLSDTSQFSLDMLMDAEQMLNMATDYAEGLNYVYYEELQEAQDKIKTELTGRLEVEEKAIDAEFLVAMQGTSPGVDTGRMAAVQGQYSYDSLYNYDILVGNYHQRLLEKGVN